PLETTDLASIAPRLVRLSHALDHLTELHADLQQVPAKAEDFNPPAGFGAGASALAAWLDATQDPTAAIDATVFTRVEQASKQLRAERKTGREQLLEAIALHRAKAAAARADLDALVWADRALYHAWRLIESLRVASGQKVNGATIDA